MSSRVMMIDVDKFTALADAKAAEYQAKAVAENGTNNDMAVYYSAIGKAINEIGVCLVHSSKIEKWD